MLVSGLMLACSEQKISTLDEHLAVTFDAQPIDSEDGTRSAYVNGDFQWTANDTVGIYPATGSQIYFSMAAGAGTSRATFDGGGWGFKSNSVYYSYYPFMADFYLNRHKIPVSFEGQVQDGRNNSEHFGLFDYMYTPGAQVNNNSLVFSYKHLVCIIEVMATLPAGTYKQITLTAPTQAFVTKGYFDLQSNNPQIIATESSNDLTVTFKESVTVNDSDPFSTFLISAPVDLNGVEITVTAVDLDGKRYDCKKTPSRAYLASTRYGLTCSNWSYDSSVHVTGISLNRSLISLKAGEVKTLEATVEPENASDKTIIWTIDDSGIASVDSAGNVTAKKDGTAFVTATTEDGHFSATCKVSVSSNGNNENPDVGGEWQW